MREHVGITDDVGRMVIAKRVIGASCGGVLISNLVALPVVFDLMRLAKHLLGDGNQGFTWLYPWFFDLGVRAFPETALVSVPLVACALVVAVTFRRSIQRRPAAWCISTLVLVWFSACAVLAWDSFDDFAIAPFQRMWAVMSSKVALLLFVAPLPSICIFYVLSWPNHQPTEA